MFDNIIKDLEQDKLKYHNTPRKSLSFTIEDKENFKYTPGNSPMLPLDRDRTFQLDHLKESIKSKGHYRRSFDMLREGDSNNVMSTNIGMAKTDRPPTMKSVMNIQNSNSNKLKMREKLKKLKITKTELSQAVKEIEFEKMKISELKQTVFGDIKKV